MSAQDRYNSYLELAGKETEGRDFRIHLARRPSSLAVVAPHAGGIEPGTGELAKALAENVYSLYLFEGLKPAGSAGLHITSTRFDEPRCLELLNSVDAVLTVHGCTGREPAIYAGGLDQNLSFAILRKLNASGFHAQPDLPQRGGAHPANLCNRGRLQRGVQLELTEGLRRTLFAGLDRTSRRRFTPAFHHLVQTLQQVLFHHHPPTTLPPGYPNWT